MTATSDTTIDVEAFEQALINHQFDAAKNLLSKVDINAPDQDGVTYLMRACLQNNLETFKWLQQNGAKLDVQDKSKRNLLFMAINSNSLDIIKWLTEKGLFLDTMYNNRFPLDEAILSNKFDAVKALVTSGATLDTQNVNGKTPLDVARDNGKKEMLKWLLTHKSFEILDSAIYEEGKVSDLQSYFNKYGYEYLNARSEERNMTLADYAASMHQVEVLKWLKSKNIPIDDSLLTEYNTQKRETFNLLLIGETGVGKSTFINAFMNYLNFETLDEAENASTIHSLIPSNFTVTDENFQPRLIKFGKDANESVIPGASATQSARSYVFDAGIRIRLIDTPGIGDTRGIGKDEENFDRLLTVIGELQEIHGICILLKPNNARLTVLFEYCVKQMLSRLQKDASNNIMFLFTNSRSTFYRPGDTVTPLKTILNEIKSKPPFIDIPFSKKNVFCVDNEAFRFLIAKRNNIQFDDDEKDNFSKSWTKSASVSVQLVKYLKSLKPHKIQETVSLNEARRLILRLSQPLGEMAEHIKNNISRNERYKALLSDKTKDIEDLKKYLLIPRIGLKVITLSHPMTVCTNSKCVEAIKVEDSTKKNYKQICHDHCYLSGVPKEVIGDPQLRYCVAMIDKDRTRKCKHAPCGHSYLEHMHIYYKTEPYNYTEQDKNVAKNIDKSKIDMKDINDKIAALNKSNVEYENEMKFIQNSMAKFAHFLKNNAITAYNDTYRKYLEYLIDRERKQDNGGDKALIEYFEKLLNTYEGYKNILETALTKAQQADPNQKAVVSATEINQLVEDLYKLPLSGKTIKDLYLAQKNAVTAEILTSSERTVRPRPNTNASWYCKYFNVLC